MKENAARTLPTSSAVGGRPKSPVRRSQVIKRSVILNGHNTSISLEDAFWDGLQEIATARQTTRARLIEVIDAARMGKNLCSEIRLFVLETFYSGWRRPKH